MKLKWIFLGLVVVGFILLYSSSEEETQKKTYLASGTVETYSPEQLKISLRMDVGLVREYTFKITAGTKIAGSIREGGQVSVVYTQYRFGRRLLMTALEINGEGG